MDADVVVVGAGAVGSAAARELARRGLDVIALERFRIGHDRGSSHGDARIFRHSYDAPDWVRMMKEAMGLWAELEDEAGEELLTRTGGIDLDAPPENATSLDAEGMGYEVLSGAAVMERFPSLSLAPEEEVLFQADAGIVHADRAWRALVEGARRAGAEVREGVQVVELRADEDGVEARTDGGTISARVGVVAAGSWALDLLRPVGIAVPARVTRESPAYFESEPPPVVVVDWHGEHLTYALPSPGFGLKAAEHHAGPEVDPDDWGGPDEASVARVRAWVAERFAPMDPRPLHAEACLYTTTADERFVLERHGAVVVASACSGHGFKFVPWSGARAAELALRRS
ncbi:MAG TPA: N-methyl-L-tryptophan oxidase [Actinomycetota bacterium]